MFLQKQVYVYKVAFDSSAEKEFLKLEKSVQEFVAAKIIDLKNGNFN